MFTGRPVGEHPPHEASTVALMDAYSNAWMQAQRAEVDKGMALTVGSALVAAQDAADYLRNGRSWLALDALKQGAESAPRPADQSAFAVLAEAVERWRPVMLNCKDGDPSGREELAADVQKLHDDMMAWVDRTLGSAGQRPPSVDDADELGEAESLEQAQFSGP